MKPVIDILCDIKQQKDLSLYQALLYYIELNDLEPSEVLQSLDPNTVEIIKQDALTNGALKPSIKNSILSSTINGFFDD